jgi:hypothetical protein
MKRVGIGNIEVSQQGEVFSETATRLIGFGCTEPQAYSLSKIISLGRDATDTEVEAVVISALIAAKQAVGNESEVEYVGGRRCDLQRRLEGRE